MPRIDVPFRRVATDLIGSLKPVTYNKNRYILTLVDYATGYPEAVPLASIDTETEAEALVSIFSHVGIPNKVLTDMGTQYTSAVMKKVSRLLSFKQLVTTPYHLICNGLVERFNQTIKKMLMRLCAERPKDWDKYIDPLLLAYREAGKRQLKVGDKALVLLPIDKNKLLMGWKRYEVVEKLSALDYRIRIGGKEKSLHINLLKQYLEREDDQEVQSNDESQVCAVS